MVMYFVVQSFNRGKRGALLPDVPVQATGEGHAKRVAERLSESKEGVVAFSRSGDLQTGEFEDTVILVSYGNLPEFGDGVAAA